jgi:hypothetical protein
VSANTKTPKGGTGSEVLGERRRSWRVTVKLVVVGKISWGRSQEELKNLEKFKERGRKKGRKEGGRRDFVGMTRSGERERERRRKEREQAIFIPDPQRGKYRVRPQVR